MQVKEIRSRFLKFFEKRDHVLIPSASLVTADEKGITNPTLFNTAGMQPLIPYLLGKKHEAGTRLVNFQKCIRTIDIDEVGDNVHATFFEMLGNWSLGDYFKAEAIKWSYEFLTNKDEGLGLDPARLYVTVFEGDKNAPRDDEAYEIWKKYVPESRIYFLGAKNNWWDAGESGPCGPDSEMYYDITGEGLGELTPEKFIEMEEKKYLVEIWNDVFMEYEKKDGRVIGKLKDKNVDTGAGLERLAMVLQNKNNIYDIDVNLSLLEIVASFEENNDLKARRIIVDHVKAAVFLIADGVVPANTDRGYVLRKLLRRAVRYAHALGITKHLAQIGLIEKIVEEYGNIYDNLLSEKNKIIKEILAEEEKFKMTLEKGLKEFSKLNNVTGQDAFKLFTTYGFPLELTLELAKEREINVDVEEFNKAMAKHKDESRKAAEGKFKGGLSSEGEKEIKYHTATHLLNQALREVLGNHVIQKGSNITEERLRFDFLHGEKLTDEQKKKVEDLVNEKIEEGLPVTFEEIPLEEAKKRGAMGVFESKYNDLVKVYQIGSDDNIFSLEICGGPHVSNTKELGKFKIQKEEAVAAGIRRIKAVLE